MNVAFAFTTSGLKHIDFDKYEKDFTFVVNGKEFKTNKYISDILSPKISNYHLIDPKILKNLLTKIKRGV